MCGCWVCLGKPRAFISLSGFGLLFFHFWNMKVNVSIPHPHPRRSHTLVFLDWKSALTVLRNYYSQSFFFFFYFEGNKEAGKFLSINLLLLPLALLLFIYSKR